MAGGPGSVWGVLYVEDRDYYIEFEIDEEGLSFDGLIDQLSPDNTRDLYDALKAYYEEVADAS